jgi:DNA-binding Lrp family transcriptional regulator
MDDTDLTITLILSGNSRISYHDLAGILNLSVNAVHKRVKNLVKSGIIRKFVTKLNLPFTNVLIYGSCKTNDLDKAYIKLGEHVNVYNVTVSSDNYLIIHAQLEIQDLDSLVSFVRKTAEMTEPTIGLQNVYNSRVIHDFFNLKGPDEDEFLPDISNSSIDYLIVDSIKNNSRKTVTEISNEIGVSSKTVRRRLNRMIEKNLIHCTIDFFPDKSGDITANIIVKMKPGAGSDEKEILVEKLKEKFGIKIVYHWVFSNLPNEMIILLFIHSMRELQEIEKFVSKFTDTVESHRIIIGYKGDIFDSVRERYLSEKIKEIKEKSK